MSIKLMDKVWSSHIPDSRLKLLVLAIADAANDDGECWPKIATLATKIDKDPRTVQRYIQKLKKLGWLSSEVRRKKDGLQTSNMYVLHSDNLPSDATTHVVTPATTHVVTPATTHVVTPATTHVVTPSMNLHIEPSVEPSFLPAQNPSAADEQRQYVQNGKKKKTNEKINQGKHSFGEYHEFVNSLHPSKTDAERIGLASYLHYTGKDDEAVSAWMKAKDQPAKNNSTESSDYVYPARSACRAGKGCGGGGVLVTLAADGTPVVSQCECYEMA